MGRRPWQARGGLLPPLFDDVEYIFGAWDRNESYGSGWIYFHGRDLNQLKPGQVLVEHYLNQSGGAAKTGLAVIELADLPHESCKE